MTKTKVKLILFIALSVIGLIIGFFFAGYVNLLLSGGNIDDISALRPALIWASIVENERHRMLTLCVELVIVAGIAALMLMSRRETFESDTMTVAGSINTPIAIGQGQHGTARWLKRDERHKAFAVHRLEQSDVNFAALLLAGARDGKEIDNFDEQTNPGACVTPAPAETPEPTTADA
jgi:type IV secretion system protein VirD4